MKATKECYPCLERLVRQAADLSTQDPELKTKAIDEGLKLLKAEFSIYKPTIPVATLLHRRVRTITGNPDPYLQIKEAEMKMGEEFYQHINLDGNIAEYLLLAVQGNSIDFFKALETVKKDLTLPVEFAIDNTKTFEIKLNKTKQILFLADNAGEVFFDLPLVRKLADFAPITYVVKHSPVQNDITLADLDRFGLTKDLPQVITTGTDTPGVDIDMASPEFKDAFKAADLVIAKGMGYWETLSELPAEGKVFYLLKAKCQPVADSLSVALNSYVALLR